MATVEQYDAIIIGAGQSGGPLSTALAQAGRKTAIIERVHVGGTCINEGCTPTKTMIASGRVAYLARRGADYGVHTGPITIDMQKVRQRKRDIVDSFRNGSQSSIESVDGVDLVMGEASFTGPTTVEVRLTSGAVRQLTASTIIINAGARPAKLSLPGIEQVATLDSTSIMELDSVPQHLLVIGGGYIGLEFGQLFRRLGSAVTIIQRGANLLAREDQDVAEEVAKIMREDGLEVLLETKPVRAEQSADGTIHLVVQTPSGERTLSGTHLLGAAGRTPNTDWLNLEATGVQTDKHGFIQVNERLETSIPGIYASGDIKGGPAFTHISYDDFRILRANLLEHGHASIHDRLVPYTVFIDPQLGRVGMSETEARSQGRTIKVAKMSMTSVARALEMDETRGFMKAIVDAGTGQILGGAVLGIEGGEIMSILEVAMMGKLPYTTLRDAIFAHPTLAESLNNLFSTLD
ncbi:MAG: mercuric reductase [Ktedonobacteraceae bacterium]|nr:mercuric reductase [Ktedonobacteraceae bacterium]